MNATPESVVDAHVHLWDRERFDYEWLAAVTGPLEENFFPYHLAEALDFERSGVNAVVAVQADCRDDQAFAEAQWLDALAEAGAPIVGIVASAPLELGEHARSDIARLAQLPRVTGVRRLLQDRPDGFATSPGFVNGVQLLADYDLAMDLCIRQHQFAEVTDLVSRCPDVVFVLDHLGKPVVSDADYPSWAAQMDQLASLPNTRCKISGLMTEAPPGMRSAASLRPWIDHAIAAFGPDRCLYGSDWPVLTEVSTYSAWFDIVSTVISDLPADQRTAILGVNALATYDPARRQARMKELNHGAH